MISLHFVFTIISVYECIIHLRRQVVELIQLSRLANATLPMKFMYGYLVRTDIPMLSQIQNMINKLN